MSQQVMRQVAQELRDASENLYCLPIGSTAHQFYRTDGLEALITRLRARKRTGGEALRASGFCEAFRKHNDADPTTPEKRRLRTERRARAFYRALLQVQRGYYANPPRFPADVIQHVEAVIGNWSREYSRRY